jgi:hypothetical protein
MSERFEDVEIDGAFIREIALVPSKTLRMILLRAPQTENEEQVTRVSDLKFYEVRYCHANFHAEPWLEIKSHDSLGESEYREQHLAPRLKNVGSRTDPASQTSRVFRIICEEGEIAVIAKSFEIALIETMPYFGPAEAT